MEDAVSAVPEFSFKRFLLRSLLPNLVLLAALLVVLFWCKSGYASGTATRINFLSNLGAMVFAWIYAVFLVIFTIRRFSRKQYLAGLIFLAEFFAVASIGYWLYLILALFGFAYAMKGH